MADESKKAPPAPPLPAPDPRPAQNISVRLVPSGQADLPLLANITQVQLSPPGVVVDFGFLEPAAIAALDRTVRSGGKMPDSINGRLAARLALTGDAMVTLHQQLGQAIAGLQAARLPRQDEKAS